MGKKYVEALKIHKSQKNNQNKKWLAFLGQGIFFYTGIKIALTFD